MFTNTAYTGVDGGFGGSVFTGGRTPDLDEHPDSAHSRMQWLSVEDEDDADASSAGAATATSDATLAAILNQRDQEAQAKHKQMLLAQKDEAQRLLRGLHDQIPTGIPAAAAAAAAQPVSWEDLTGDASAALERLDAVRSPPSGKKRQPKAKSPATIKSEWSPAAERTRVAANKGRPRPAPAKTAAGAAGQMKRGMAGKVPMSRNSLLTEFQQTHGDMLASLGDLVVGSQPSEGFSAYLYENGLMQHVTSLEQAFKQLFPRHPVEETSLKKLDKPDLDRLIRTAGLNVHDAKKLRDLLLGTAPLEMVAGDDHFDSHFDPGRLKSGVSSGPWDQSQSQSGMEMVDAAESILQLEGGPERRTDSKVIKSSFGSDSLSFRTTAKTGDRQQQAKLQGRAGGGAGGPIRGMQRRKVDGIGISRLRAASATLDHGDVDNTVRLAAKEGNLNQLKKLLDQSSGSTNACDAQGRTPILLAAEAGYDDCVDELLRRGAQVNLFSTKDGGLHTALTLAAHNGHCPCVKLLLAKDADVDHKATEKSCSGSPLALAVKSGHIPCVRVLLTHDASTETADVVGNRPLFLAAQGGRLDCLMALLEHNAELDVQCNDNKRTAFMTACTLGGEDCVKALIAAGCDKDIQDKTGKTALMFACMMGHRQIVEILVDNGCDIEIKDSPKGGKSAKDYAKAGPVRDYFAELSAGAADELMAMLEKDKVDEQAKDKGKKKKKQKKKKQQKAQEEPEAPVAESASAPAQVQARVDVQAEPEPEVQQAWSEPEPDLDPEPEPDPEPAESEPQVNEVSHATSPPKKKKGKKKGKAASSEAESDAAGTPQAAGASGGASKATEAEADLRQLRQERGAKTAAARDSGADQQAQRDMSDLRRERKALQLKVEALERSLAEQASAMAAQESEFSARIEESWTSADSLRDENAALQREKNIAQHEAAQYRRHKEELESALAERKDESSDVSWRARSESEVLLMNENQRLRAETKDLNEMLDKERTAATHANHQFQAQMQQMNAASFDQGTRLQQANDIIRQLQMGKALEHADANALRRQRADYMLHQLQIITNGWIHDIGNARGIHQPGVAPLRVFLFTFGSFRLEVDDASSDVDVLVMVPPLVDREADFFGIENDHGVCPSMLSRLKQDERVQGVVAVADAYVPCIKMSFGGIDFDLTFANVLRSELPQQSEWGDDVNSWRAGPGNFAVDGAMHALAHDLPSVRSFVGVHATHCVLRSMQQHYETFRQTLVYVKAWAKQRGVYGSMMGYPGGVAWTLLTAFYCRQRFAAMHGSHSPPTVGNMLTGFFSMWSEWPWPQPVELVERSSPGEQTHPVLDGEVWRPTSESPSGGSGSSMQSGAALMPIISPAYPQINTTHTVSGAAFRVIQEELQAAAQLSSAAGIGGCYSLDEWLEISGQQEPTHRSFLRRYPKYLYIEVSAEQGNARRAQWFALAKAWLRHVVTKLESADELARAHLFPSSFDLATMQPPASGAMGAEGNMVEAASGAPLLYCVGFAFADGFGVGANVAHAERLCVAAVEEVAAQITTKAQRGEWHTPDMTCAGRVVAAGGVVVPKRE